MKNVTKNNLDEAIELATRFANEKRSIEDVADALKVADELDGEDIDKNFSLYGNSNDVIEKNKDEEIYIDDIDSVYVDYKAINALRNRKKRLIKTALILATIMMLFFTASILTLFLLKLRGKTKLRKITESATPMPVGEDVNNIENYVYRNGIKYEYNEENITVLVMGIDDKNDADANLLFVINAETNDISCININRDAISRVKMYSPAGEYITTSDIQIALAYSYGIDDKNSSELMTAAISDMMYRIPIHAYISLNMEKIPDINDAVGGVTVKSIETLDESIIKDVEITLNGDMALSYVTERDSHSGKIGTNEARIKRQSQYISAWYEKLMSVVSGNKGRLMDIYKQLKGDIVTNLEFDEVTYLADVVTECSFDKENIYYLPGRYERKNYYDEFVVDEEALADLILQIFYRQVD